MSPGPTSEESLDRLVGDWRILQLKRGHRFSTDDLVTAWRAKEARPQAQTLLDLGSGIGSVGLTTLWHLPRTASLVGVEAQEVSVRLARRTAELNGLLGRVNFLHGDLRDPTVLPAEAKFDLITGSPPYIPPGKGVLSPVPQRAAARIELRGSVFDYCAAAARHLAPGGRFCFVMAAGDPRMEQAPLAAGLAVAERYDITFRFGRDPLIATLVCAWPQDLPDGPRRQGHLVVRGPDGEWTADYHRFRLEVGSDFLVQGAKSTEPISGTNPA